MQAIPDTTPSVIIETRILGFSAERMTVPLPSTRLKIADLIRAKIAEEWEAHARGERATVGRESMAPEALARPGNVPLEPSLEEAVKTALDGYRAGWYIILVDGEEPGGLDSLASLAPDSAVSFVRVYPLPDAL